MTRYRKNRHRYNKKHFHPRHQPRRYSLFQRTTYFATHHPITIGIGLIFISIILFRLSFTNVFLSSSEVLMWSILLSIGLFIAGVLTLIGWWRNHILQHTVGVKLGHWQ